MNEERFAALVFRLEADARRRPAWYRLRIAFLAMLGLVVPILVPPFVCGLIVLALLLLHIWALAIKFVWILAIALAALARAYFFRVPDAYGLELTRDNAPRLFALLDQLLDRSGAPRPDLVTIDGALNASVTVAPRFGLFGGTIRRLAVGLPLLFTLTEPQVEAVLAHEFGHLERKRNRFSTWIYSLRSVMYQQATFVEESGNWATAVLVFFYRWLLPRFKAYSLVLARQVERTADGLAIEVAGAENLASALTAMAAANLQIATDFNRSVINRARFDPEPPVSVFGEQRAFLAATASTRGEFAQLALAERIRADDTHPALPDRLQAMDISPNQAIAAMNRELSGRPDAATALLGDELPQLSTILDKIWQFGAREEWNERRRLALYDARTLAALDEAAATGLNPTQERQRAFLAAEAERPDSEMLLRDVLLKKEDSARAHAYLGKLLIERGAVTEALEHLERALASSTDDAKDVARFAIWRHYVAQGRIAEALSLTETSSSAIEK